MSDKESLWPHIAYIAAHHRDCNDSDKAEGVTVGDLRAWRDEIEHIHLENAKLTAAAEVKAPLFDQRTPDGPFELASGEAMPAAAEVGGPLTDYTQWDKIVAERDALRKQVAAAEVHTNPKELTHDEWCRLSRLFNQNADLGAPLDYYINEWLKERIAWANITAAAAIRALKDRP